ncbi:MAG TPA: sodium-translocating pyrophosphatase [bacterium]|nr:sodium-translocating pyrophosphatase [Candidatus Omnitrophota bacterium]HOJ60390.1 sodium-translocating pyrophosphatase [bacterium]HOL94976.1 sodium-translocating pyrophosphatase [bacterium]HPP02528.1 sodium-translocating pyrophosphatase [bacterium]
MELIISALAAIAALVFVWILSKDVLAHSPGNEKMQEISHLIQIGARAFLKREYMWVSGFVVVIAILFSIGPRLMSSSIPLGWPTALAFMFGAAMSALAGYIGMSIATRANGRTTQAAQDHGLKGALGVAVSGGAVMGLSVVGLGLLGLVLVQYIAKGDSVIVNGYAMGASLMALFARSGGGIYTKGADMGADLVGKVEAGIPEDDPRNPAVIADNVGDNVGDVAGLGADLFESYVEAIIAALAIAVACNAAMNVESSALTVIPFAVAAVGILCSIAGVFYVRQFGSNNPQGALMGGTYISAIATIVVSGIVIYFIGEEWHRGGDTYNRMAPFYTTVIGVLSGIVIGFMSEYYTSSKYKPVRRLAENSQSGPAITVTDGTALGMESTAIPVIVLAVSVIFAFWLGGFYGVAMAALGMLATTGMVVTVDSYGPIADNAGGIAEMAGLDPSVRKITDNLDAVGNTTAAIGKGFAIGSAAYAAIGLISAFLVSANLSEAKVSLINVHVIAGLMIGGMLPYFFSAQLFRAVSKAAFRMIEEVRRQFREIPGLMDGTGKPDSARCVDISTQGAINGMLLPGTIAILVPPIVGFSLGPETLAGVLLGTLVTGLLVGIQAANSGGAMDNAKKYIEEGHFGGKGSETHKAAVVGDTVGDPLKDTVGPSINILIKLMAVISLVLAPLMV